MVVFLSTNIRPAWHNVQTSGKMRVCVCVCVWGGGGGTDGKGADNRGGVSAIHARENKVNKVNVCSFVVCIRL